MKRFLPLLLTAFLFTCCNNSQHRYDELNAKYSGKYIVKDMITDTEDIYDLFNTGNSSYDVYYQFAWKSTTTATDVKPGRVTVSLSSEERISATFLMELQAMYAGSVMPPYTAATEVTTATNLQTWRQSFDGVIQSDDTIKWADGVSEEDPDSGSFRRKCGKNLKSRGFRKNQKSFRIFRGRNLKFSRKPII